MRSRRLVGQARRDAPGTMWPVRQRGYTIIELMFVIAVLGVLVVIAITAYTDYTTRTKMLEVMLAAGKCKTAVFDAYYYAMVPEPGRWGCETSDGTRYVQSITVDPNGKVLVTVRGFFDEDIDGKVFTLTPIVDGEPAVIADGKGKILQWRCGNTNDGTTIPNKFLPFTCRGGS
ncbi:MAG TPA: pilin [Xanthomonadales bacterium]|nr:pilin [Xanthomonadales bacterium]